MGLHRGVLPASHSFRGVASTANPREPEAQTWLRSSSRHVASAASRSGARIRICMTTMYTQQHNSAPYTVVARLHELHVCDDSRSDARHVRSLASESLQQVRRKIATDAGASRHHLIVLPQASHFQVRARTNDITVRPNK